MHLLQIPLKYTKILLLFIKNCLMGYMEYRTNLYMEIISELAYVFLKLVYVLIIYNTQVSINGLPAESMLLIGGNYMILTGLFIGFFMMNIFELSDHVRNGVLDLLIVKPVSLQFMVSFRRFQFGAFIPNLIVGTVMIVIGIQELELKVDFLTLLGYFILTLSAVVIAYTIYFSLQLICFWVINTSALSQTLELIWDNNNMPMTIYSKWIMRLGIFVIPLFLISNFPSLFLMDMLSPSFIVWGIVAPFIFLGITRLLWMVAIKNYSSASS